MSGMQAVADERERESLVRGRGETMLFAAVSCGLLALGAVEDWFGANSSRDLYGSDAVQYLDIARAIERGDWHSALNPLWSQGYPALLALTRPLFGAGPWGDWLDTRVLNFVIFTLCWAAFCWLVRRLLESRVAAGLRGMPLRLAFGGATAIFLATQLTIGQASRTGPDELVATCFFAACALLLGLIKRPSVGRAVVLGLLLGAGFLVKAAFLPIGAVLLLVAAYALFSKAGQEPWAGLRTPAVAGAIFAVIVLGYGAALSSAVGHRTLGESGAINYAWHVNRLAKWVHWEGGTDPAAKAWPKPAVARFAQWESAPPDFGRPLHPSLMVGSRPTIYVFHGSVPATYVPYFDPAYWYAGYRHVFRWRYQVIALAKNTQDLAEVLDRQPLVYALVGVLLVLGWRRETRRLARKRLASAWPVVLLGCFAVAVFVPVHLEGRYFSGALAVLVTVVLLAVCAAREERIGRGEIAVCAGLLLIGTVAGLVVGERQVITRIRAGWSPAHEQAWVTGEDVAALLPAGTEVGMISWQPNLESDWAYMAGVRITSEIADGADERSFWALPAERRAAVLGEFRQAGAKAVLTWDRPQDARGWRQVAGMWMYTF